MASLRRLTSIPAREPLDAYGVKAFRADGLHSYLVDRLFRRKTAASVTAEWLAYLNRAARRAAATLELSYTLLQGYFHIVYCFRLPYVIESNLFQEPHTQQHLRSRTWRYPCEMRPTCRPPGPRIQPPHWQAFVFVQYIIVIVPIAASTVALECFCR